MAGEHRELLRAWCEERDGDARRQLIESHLPLVRVLAQRFARRGEQLDDLTQVGAVGLIKAVDRYDPARGSSFTAYAVPTILGEIRRHLRDAAQPVRAPRRGRGADRRPLRAARGGGDGLDTTPSPSAGSSSGRSGP